MKLNGAHSWDVGPEPEQPLMPNKPITMKATIIQKDRWKARRPWGIERCRESRVFAIAEEHSLPEKKVESSKPTEGIPWACASKDMSIKERGHTLARLAAG